jgi:hypothetical protein
VNGRPTDAATLVRICQSSTASPGVLMAFDAACTMPWSFVKVPSFSTHAAPGSTRSATFASAVESTPW